ncbi:glycosyltransferase family 4 protein [Mangrovibacterium diazotrophicum]|nr:glycosyltransferase family 4 protein [Mangrovibacterium diazotrophicum]
MKNKYLDNLRAIAQVLYYFLFYKIDLVYFTCTRSKVGAVKDIILLLLCRLRKVKVINHLHGNEIMDLFDNSLFSKIILYAYRQIDTTIFVTNRQQELMPSSLTEMKKCVIPNCYDPVLESVKRRIPETVGEINILFVSFLMKSKGILVALDVFELIANEYSDVSFHIAGEPLGDEYMATAVIKEAFEKRLEVLKQACPGRFIYHGVVKGQEKIKLFESCDIFLFPTFFKTESFGLVNIEAMRTGNVVVTTNHNFLPDIVTKEEGILVEPQNTEETYKAVKHLIDNPELMRAIQRHNMEHAQNKYSPSAFERRIIDLFESFNHN